MKVAVVNSMAPFVWGGAEELASHLIRNLRDQGLEAHDYRIPFAWEPYTGLPFEIARSKLLRFDDYDRVISLKFPVYCLEAEHHTTWLIHQFRQAYDLWNSPYCGIPHDAAGIRVRNIIHDEDRRVFTSRERLFTISEEISRRLRDATGVVARPLRAPLNDPQLFQGGPDEGYILAPGRVNAAKRQSLLVRAAAKLPANCRLIVAGPPESDEDARALHELVERHSLEDKVELDLRFLSREELARYVNHSRAVAYIPFQEDSYGYVTMEAFEAGKPVVTSNDAGELLEIVKHGHTGQVAEPTPEALAAAMDRYISNGRLAASHGMAAREGWRSLGINWGNTIEALLGTRSC
ncbi:glycosyltransferase family 4 protein [Sphingomonas humi]|uniref:Glycosyltransferase family 4 protein n=1 Tax=Sphingomonas humi TaxID=335630 RepID=A0ABP7S2J6_9SPHN